MAFDDPRQPAEDRDDAAFGVAFLFFHEAIFAGFAIAPPNHPAYVHFPALLLLIFAAMLFRIASDPAAYRHLIGYCVALKAAYSGSVFWYQLKGGVPFMWVPMAWVDALFLVLFIAAWKQLAADRAGSAA